MAICHARANFIFYFYWQLDILTGNEWYAFGHTWYLPNIKSDHIIWYSCMHLVMFMFMFSTQLKDVITSIKTCVITSKSLSWRQKHVIMSKTRHDVKRFVMTSKMRQTSKTFVMASTSCIVKKMCLFQEHVMTSKGLSWRQKCVKCLEIKLKKPLWCQKVCQKYAITSNKIVITSKTCYDIKEFAKTSETRFHYILFPK